LYRAAALYDASMRPGLLLVTVLGFALGGCGSEPAEPARSQPSQSTAPPPAAASAYEPGAEDIASLKSMLAPDYRDFDQEPADSVFRAWPPGFRAASYDLDQDGTPELLVLLDGNYDCGSGGCSFRVYRRGKEGLRKVSGSTVTRLPIGVLESTSQGWRDLTVGIGGGGLDAGPSRAILRFNGEHYPLNPTTPPAERSGVTGVAVLTEASPLHSLVD
jgi:hypothetical protein